jgi:hypothetical protein
MQGGESVFVALTDRQQPWSWSLRRSLVAAFPSPAPREAVPAPTSSSQPVRPGRGLSRTQPEYVDRLVHGLTPSAVFGPVAARRIGRALKATVVRRV